MMMIQVTKPAGFGNVVLEEVPIPECGPRDVLVKNKVSLISRGSEILRRYMHEEAIDPAIMGYSVGGVVAAVGEEAAERFQPGDRVVATAPHAQYVIQDIDRMDGSRIWPIPDDISFEQAAFLPLTSEALSWSLMPDIQPHDTIVILGQGLIGNLVLQSVRLQLCRRVITVDAIEKRCTLSQSFGADMTIHAKEDDPVAVVSELTDGQGANIVIDCVGGKAGLTSFAQAQDMLAYGGTLLLVGMYHGGPLPLDSAKIHRRRLIAGFFNVAPRGVMLDRAINTLQRGQIRTEPLISHRFPFQQAKEAYDMLYERLSEAMVVLLTWE
ncbi:MAG: zinc-binding dehydrogenase [Chloroflexota bacterium]